MIDIHNHILPNVDDGSKSMEESIDLIKGLIKSGVTGIVLTPHYMIDGMDTSVDVIKDQYVGLKKAVQAQKIDIPMYLGQELYLDSRLIKDMKEKKCLTIHNTKYILVELPLNGTLLSLETLLHEIKIEGYKVILAHAERYTFLHKNSEKLKDFMAEGLLIQMNLGSLNGHYGKNVKKFAKMMIKNRWVHFLGSDVHRKDSNLLKLEKPLKYIKKRQGKAWLFQLKYEFPQKMLNNEPLPEVTHKKKHKGLKWLIIFLISLVLIVQGVNFGIKKLEAQFESIMIEQGKVYKEQKLQQEAQDARLKAEAEAKAKVQREALRLLEKEEREAKRKAEDLSRAAEKAALDAEMKAESLRIEEALEKAKDQEEMLKVQKEAEALKQRLEKEKLKAELEAEALEKARIEEEKKALEAIAEEEARLEAERLEAERVAAEEKARIEAELEAKYNDYETDKARAMDLALSKLSVSQVNELIKMAAGGFTPNEKKRAKEMFYNNFTSSEQEWILEMYAKYYGG